MKRDISNTADIIDTRDIISRISDLEGELQDTHDTAKTEYAALPEEEKREPDDKRKILDSAGLHA